MSTFRNNPISRRTAIAGAVASWAMLRAGTGIARQSDRPATVDLGQGLEVRDYRLFPTEDVMRFIVELHNTTDTAVDTRSVGVVLPHLDEDNFGWAIPISPVLHPHTSDCLIGVAPVTVETDDDWRSPEWILCDDIDTQLAESLHDWDFEFSQSTEMVRDTWARTLLQVTNHGTELGRTMLLQGIVRDFDGRICGALLPVGLGQVAPGTTKELTINLQQSHNYLANPFTLIDSVDGVELTFSLQPRGSAMNPGCDAIMPWNR